MTKKVNDAVLISFLGSFVVLDVARIIAIQENGLAVAETTGFAANMIFTEQPTRRFTVCGHFVERNWWQFFLGYPKYIFIPLNRGNDEICN